MNMNFSFQVGVILFLETWILQSQQRWLLLVLTPPSSWVSAVRSETRASAVSSRLGFKQEVILLGVALLP